MSYSIRLDREFLYDILECMLGCLKENPPFNNPRANFATHLSSSILHVHVRYDRLQDLGERNGNSALGYDTIKVGAS